MTDLKYMAHHMGRPYRDQRPLTTRETGEIPNYKHPYISLDQGPKYILWSQEYTTQTKRCPTMTSSMYIRLLHHLDIYAIFFYLFPVYVCLQATTHWPDREHTVFRNQDTRRCQFL